MTEKVLTVLEVLTKGTAYLERHGIRGTARLDAEVLLAHLLGCQRIELYVSFDRPLTGEEADAYRQALRERARRKPVAYITGHKEFYGRDFLVDPRVLIPRPETELLVETVLAELRERFPGAVAPAQEAHQGAESLPGEGENGGGAGDLIVLEVGVGSGVVALTLALEAPRLRVLGTEVSPEALAVAQANVDRLAPALSGKRLSFFQGDLLPPLSFTPPFLQGEEEAGLAGKVAAVISNPPYIPTAEIARLMPEVRLYEPRLALDGGADGLAFYRRLFPAARPYLAPEGFIACEIGAGQGAAVTALAEAAGYAVTRLERDYAGWERVLVACYRRLLPGK